MKLKTLSGHNKAREALYEAGTDDTPVKNGIECPECKAELLDSNPMHTLLSIPPQKDIFCEKCGFTGCRVA